MKKILAVSGGIDSMVMLHLFRNDPTVVVAHFNHGTRASADDDQCFVERIARANHFIFETTKMNLGASVSEDCARRARYDFLRQLAQKYQSSSGPALIYTAHHLDDLVESIAVNLSRGTGWRGLASLNAVDLRRPFLDYNLLPKDHVIHYPFSQADILRYAATHSIIYREDPTNHEDNYLRNRIRTKLFSLSPAKRQELEQAIYLLWQQQTATKTTIDQIVTQLLPSDLTFSRALFKELDDATACEILRAALTARQISLTRPQLQRFLLAIRTYQPEKSFNLPGQLIKIHKTHFAL